MYQSLISVIMPVFNVEKYVAEAVKSIQNQTYINWELIAVDDGSTDASLEILKQLAQEDSRIKVIQGQHQGISVTRNIAIQHSHGDYIANLDADDIALPERLEKQLGYLNFHPDCLALSGKVIFIDSDRSKIFDLDVKTTPDDIKNGLYSGIGLTLPNTSAMFPRRSFDIAGMYNTHLKKGEDLELYLRLSLHGKLANLSEPLVYMRLHPTSTTAMFSSEYQNTPSNIQLVKDFVVKNNITLKKHPEPPKTKPIQSLAHWHSFIAQKAAINGNLNTAWKHLRISFYQQPLKPFVWQAFFFTLLSTLLGQRGISFLRQVKKNFATTFRRMTKPRG
jgi:glycosyltransferase involved in cell wall biosynthesis